MWHRPYNYVSIPFSLGDIYVGLPLKGLIAGCISCRNDPSVTSVALFQQFTWKLSAAVCIPLLAHLSSHKTINAPKIDYRELVIKGDQAHQRHCLSHAVLWRWYRQIQWHRFSNWQRWSWPFCHSLAVPGCTTCNSPPINHQCTNHRIAV